jgi:Cu/Zn superoxide dismutase
MAGLQGAGEEYGTIQLFDHLGRTRIKVTLRGLPAGPYALELHEGSSCDVSFESHPGPEGASPLMPVPAGAAGGLLATAAGPTRFAVLSIAADGADREMIDVPPVSDAAQFKGHAIIIRGPENNDLGPRGDRLLCGVLR